MNRNKTKIQIEFSLLKAMNALDEATGLMLKLDTDNDEHNASAISVSKANIKRVLQQGYDKCARDRKN